MFFTRKCARPTNRLARDENFMMRTGYLLLSARNPPAVDGSALAHLLFFLFILVCMCSCSNLHGSECVFSLLCLCQYLCINMSLGCMKWRRQAQVCTEWGVAVTSRGFPRTVFTFYCSRVRGQGIEGRLVDESRGNVYITLLGSKNISGWLPSQGLAHNGVKQQS